MLASLFALLGLAAVICRVGRASPQIAPLSAVGAIILTLYAAVMFGVLETAACALFVLGLFAFLAEAAIFRSKTVLLSSGLLVYGIAAFAIWLWLRDAVFFSWDDFSHWGLRTKDMVANGNLQSIVMLKEYPPGANLFHYFCLWPIGMSEGGVFAANGWILATPLPMLVGKTRGPRAAFLTVSASAVLYLCYSELGVGFVSAQVDSLLTAMFVGATLSCFVAQESGTNRCWLILPLAALPLVKDSGLAFALVASVAIAVDLWFFSSLPLKHRLGLITGMILLPWGVGKSWQLHVQIEGLQKAFPVEKLSLATVVHDLFYSTSAATNAVVHHFISALQTRNVGVVLASPTVEWLCWFGGLAAVLAAVKIENVSRWRLFSVLLCLSIGFVLYVFGLLVLYVNFFKFGGEDISLASFERYMGTYLSAFVVILSFFAFRTSLQKWPLNVVALVALVWFVVVKKPLTSHFPKDEFLLANRARLDAVRAAVPPNATVQTISQGDNGGQIVRVRYALSPRPYSGNWSLGDLYKADDPYTRNLSPDELKKSLSRVNFLFLLRVDDNFWKHYSSLFEEGASMSSRYLYRIISTDKDDLKLIPVL